MNETNKVRGSDSYMSQRIIAGIVALLLTAFALLVLRNQAREGFDPLGAIFGSGVATVAVICWWFALRGHIAESRLRMKYTKRGGLILGGIGFAVGFFGPMIFTPRSNLGPLLGIFTRPLGFVLGAVIGWLYVRFHIRRQRWE